MSRSVIRIEGVAAPEVSFIRTHFWMSSARDKPLVHVTTDGVVEMHDLFITDVDLSKPSTCLRWYFRCLARAVRRAS